MCVATRLPGQKNHFGKEALRMKNVLATAITALVVFAAAQMPPARAQGPAALTGQISSAEEGPMEGVLVSAKKAGSTITITVVSDANGSYSFPAGKLEPGTYA